MGGERNEEEADNQGKATVNQSPSPGLVGPPTQERVSRAHMGWEREPGHPLSPPCTCLSIYPTAPH